MYTKYFKSWILAMSDLSETGETVTTRKRSWKNPEVSSLRRHREAISWAMKKMNREGYIRVRDEERMVTTCLSRGVPVILQDSSGHLKKLEILSENISVRHAS